jgi:hypothetical protein
MGEASLLDTSSGTRMSSEPITLVDTCRVIIEDDDSLSRTFESRQRTGIDNRAKTRQEQELRDDDDDDDDDDDTASSSPSYKHVAVCRNNNHDEHYFSHEILRRNYGRTMELWNLDDFSRILDEFPAFVFYDGMGSSSCHQVVPNAPTTAPILLVTLDQEAYDTATTSSTNDDVTTAVTTRDSNMTRGITPNGEDCVSQSLLCHHHNHPPPALEDQHDVSEEEMLQRTYGRPMEPWDLNQLARTLDELSSFFFQEDNHHHHHYYHYHHDKNKNNKMDSCWEVSHAPSMTFMVGTTMVGHGF